MNDEVVKMQLDQLESSFNKMQKSIETMPDAISAKIDANVNLKIENAVQKIKIDFYKWLVPVILGLLFDAAAVIFSFVRG